MAAWWPSRQLSQSEGPPKRRLRVSEGVPFEWCWRWPWSQPVMLPEDLAKAGPAIEAAVKKWG